MVFFIDQPNGLRNIIFLKGVYNPFFTLFFLFDKVDVGIDHSSQFYGDTSGFFYWSVWTSFLI